MMNPEGYYNLIQGHHYHYSDTSVAATIFRSWCLSQGLNAKLFNRWTHLLTIKPLILHQRFRIPIPLPMCPRAPPFQHANKAGNSSTSPPNGIFFRFSFEAFCAPNYIPRFFSDGWSNWPNIFTAYFNGYAEGFLNFNWIRSVEIIWTGRSFF